MRSVLFLILVCTFMLINLGGLVHNTGSSLACPDWPLCYGQIMPQMTGGILVEHSHRLLASLVGILVILNLVLSWKKYSWKSLQTKFSLLALMMVIFQGVLGGITVIYKLPTIISTLHLATSMLIICLIYTLLRRSNTNQKNVELVKEEDKKYWPKNFRWFVGLSLIAIYLQIVLGALMRHLGLGGACGVGAEHSFVCFDMINNHAGPFPTSAEAWINAAHRYFAVAVAIFIASWSIYYRIKIKKHFNSLTSPVNKRIIFIVSAILLQIFLGIMTVQTEIGVLATTLHLGGATILLISLLELFLFWRDVEFKNKMSNIISTFSDWNSLTKPRLSSLVLCTSFLGIMLAPGTISFISAAATIVGLYLVVSGSCMMNCYSEREVDKYMERTKDRALPAGRINPMHCFVVSLILCATGILILQLWVNTLSAILCLIASLLYIFLYTPLKKHSPIALFVGAIPGAIPPVVGWVSVTNQISFWGLILFAILFVWQLPHFLSIAIFHAKDYEKAGIKILPNTLGIQATKIRIFFYSMLLVSVSLLPVYIEKSTEPMYLFGTLAIGALFVVLAFQGILLKNKQKELDWSRNYFWSTLIYLPIQLCILVVYG